MTTATGSSKADIYVEDMTNPTDPSKVHFSKDSYNINQTLKGALEPYFGQKIKVILDDRVYLGSFPQDPKLVDFEEGVDGDGFFVFNETGYMLSSDAISAIFLDGNEKQPIFLRTYGGEERVTVYHIDIRGV